MKTINYAFILLLLIASLACKKKNYPESVVLNKSIFYFNGSINQNPISIAAGINNYESFVADLSKPLSISLSSFNLIIADVPCTGSGTWSRTPEQLYYFNELKIDEYAALQKKIVATVITQLEPGGYLLYITCSVFKKENEDIVDFIKEKFHLQEVKMELIKGYDRKADTMFAGLLKKPL